MTDHCPALPRLLDNEPMFKIVEGYRTLRGLAEATAEELTRIPGIEERCHGRLQAIFHLGWTWLSEQTPESITITNPAAAAALLMPSMAHLDGEVFKTGFAQQPTPSHLCRDCLRRHINTPRTPTSYATQFSEPIGILEGW